MLYYEKAYNWGVEEEWYCDFRYESVDQRMIHMSLYDQIRESKYQGFSIGGAIKVNKLGANLLSENKIKDQSYRIHIDVKNKYLKRVYSFFEKLNSI
jgi:hypothetical protein